MPKVDVNANAASAPRFETFAEFYPFYLREHRNVVCRTLHFMGASIALMLTIFALVTGLYALIVLAVIPIPN